MPASNTLYLTLKKEWFDLIVSGEKKEEYRDVKDFGLLAFMIEKEIFFTRSRSPKCNLEMATHLHRLLLCSSAKASDWLLANKNGALKKALNIW